MYGFIFLVRIIINKFYQYQLPKEDMLELQEDFLRISTNLVLQSKVFTALLCFCRVDTYQLDKDLRTKYDLFQGKEPSDFGIDPHLSLNMSSPIVDEVK